MNQELYHQFLDGASVIAAVQKFEQKIATKKNVWANLCVEHGSGEENIKKAKGSYGKWKGWGIFMMIFGFGNLLLIAYAMMETVRELGFDVSMAEISPIIGVALFLAAFGFMGVILLAAAAAKRRKRVEQATRECATIEETAQAKIDKLESEIDGLEARMKKYIIDNQHRLSFLPSDYRNPHAIAFMLKALENMRAETLKELINLYEQELHFLAQERILSNNAEMQRIHNESMLYAMESIRRNQEQMQSNIQFMQAMQIISMLDD